MDSQFQEREVRIAVICPVFALLRHVVLEHGRGFRVIPVEPVEDGVDVFGSVGRIVECDAHCARRGRGGEVGNLGWEWEVLLGKVPMELMCSVRYAGPKTGPESASGDSGRTER